MGVLMYWLSLWTALQLSMNNLSSTRSQRPMPAWEVSQWMKQMFDLLHEEITDEEVEFYLPQLVEVVSRQNIPSCSPASAAASASMVPFLISRCRSNQILGMNIVWQLQAITGGSHVVTDKKTMTEMASSKLTAAKLAEDAGMASMLGYNLPQQLLLRRQAYYRDSMSFVKRLVETSAHMKNVPQKFRIAELQLTIREVNKSLLRRMHTRGYVYEEPCSTADWDVDEEVVASACPDAAHFALSLPMRLETTRSITSSGNNAVRILRLVKELSHPLPSRERAPFVVVAEVLESNINLNSHRLYLSGDRVGITALDVIRRTVTPPSLLKELKKTAAAHSRSGNGIPKRGIRLEGNDENNGHVSIVDGNISEWLDRAFFDRAFKQYLTSGHSGPLIQRMRAIMSQVFPGMDGMKEKHLQQASPFGHLPGWRLEHIVVKSGDDVRQEVLAVQIITLVDRVFKEEGLALWLRPYSVVCAGPDSALVECITDAKSIDEIKKRTPNFVNMRDFFERFYMGQHTGLFGRAQDNFVRSLAGYSIITYLLQVKDRHNANILLDWRGHLVHIDFGYILGDSPGLWKHETAPFKLTQDYIDIMGGEGTLNWKKFQELFLVGFRAIQAHIHEIASLIRVMSSPGDRRAQWQATQVKKRFTELRTDEDILALITRSANSWTTQQYDIVQLLQNDIQP